MDGAQTNGQVDPLASELGILSAMRPLGSQRHDVIRVGPNRNCDGSLWKKGQSGNPKGRPQSDETWRACIRRVINEPSKKESLAGATVKEEILLGVSELAAKGVAWAVEFLADRDDGKPTQFIDVTAKRNPLEGVSDEELRAALDAVRAKRLEVGEATP